MEQMVTKLLAEVHYKLKEGKREEFLRRIKEAGIAEESRKELGNGRYEFFYPVEDPNDLMLIEVWNTEKDQKQHAQTEHYQKLSELKKIYVEETQVKITVIEVAQ